MPTSSPLKPNNPSPKIPTVVNSISSINSPLNLIKINSSTNLASAKTTAHPNHHMPNIQIELVQSLNACSEASALLK